MGIIWNRPCKEYVRIQDNLTLHLLGLLYHKQEHVYIGRVSSQEECDMWLQLGVPLLHTPKRHFTVTDTWYKKFVAPYTATGQTIHSVPPDEKILASKDIDLCIIKEDIAEYNDRPSEKTQKSMRKRSSKARTAAEVRRHHLQEPQLAKLIRYPFGKKLRF